MSSPSTKQLGLIRDLMNIGPSITILFLYIYLTCRSKIFKELVQNLISVSKCAIFSNVRKLEIHRKINAWKKFPLFCRIAVVLMLLISCLENMAYSFNSLDCNKIHNLNYSNIYFWHGKNLVCYQMQPVHQTILAIILFIGGKFVIFLWAFSDILSIVLCQAMKNVLLVFIKDLEKTYLQSRGGHEVPYITDANTCWNQIRRKYFHIVDLFEKMTNFIYPLILSCYWINIYLVIDNVIF